MKGLVRDLPADLADRGMRDVEVPRHLAQAAAGKQRAEHPVFDGTEPGGKQAKLLAGDGYLYG